jgi:hypothetical protein
VGGLRLKKVKKQGKAALDEALLKVATGYSVEEVTEEYAEVDGEMKLLKRKETKKDIPPDLKAVQILLADGNTEIAKMTDEELEKERDRLLEELSKKTAKKASAQGNGGTLPQADTSESIAKNVEKTKSGTKGAVKKKSVVSKKKCK